MQSYTTLTVGEIKLIKYLIDESKVGQGDLVIAATLVRSIPKFIPNLDDETTVSLEISEESLGWIHRQQALHLGNNNIPARMAVSFIMLSNATVIKPEVESTEEDTK